MKLSKADWQFILLILVVVCAVGANEVGFGFISLILLFPAVLLMQKVFSNNNPRE